MASLFNLPDYVPDWIKILVSRPQIINYPINTASFSKNLHKIISEELSTFLLSNKKFNVSNRINLDNLDGEVSTEDLKLYNDSYNNSFKFDSNLTINWKDEFATFNGVIDQVVLNLDNLPYFERAMLVKVQKYIKYSNTTLENDILTLKILLRPGINQINTGYCFEVGSGMILLVVPHKQLDDIHSQVVAIDHADSGFLHISVFNNSLDDKDVELVYKIFAFGSSVKNSIKFANEVSDAFLQPKRDKSMILNLVKLNPKKLTFNDSYEFGDYKFKSLKYLIVPRKRAMIHFNFVAPGFVNKRADLKIDPFIKSLYPVFSSDIVSVVEVNQKLNIKFIENDYLKHSYKSVMNGNYSQLPNYKEISTALYKISKFHKRLAEVKDLSKIYGDRMGLNEQQKANLAEVFDVIRGGRFDVLKQDDLQKIILSLDAISFQTTEEKHKFIREKISSTKLPLTSMSSYIATKTELLPSLIKRENYTSLDENSVFVNIDIDNNKRKLDEERTKKVKIQKT